MKTLLRIAVLLLAWGPLRIVEAQAQIAGKGPQLLQNSTFGKHPEVAAAGAYTIVPNTDLGNWTSGLNYLPTDVVPTANGVAIQLDADANQSAFPGDATNGIPASRTWLYMFGNTAATATADFWQQNVSVRPNTTYTFSCYASNATAVAATTATAPQLDFYIGGTKQNATTFDIVKETAANGGDKWTRYSVSFTTSGNQTALSLALRNPRSTTGTGNALAISSISFRSDNPGAVNTRYSCDGQFYQIRQVIAGTPQTNSTRLFNVDRGTGNAYTTVEQKDLGATLNCLGYRPGDGLQYALTYVSNGVNNANNAAGADRINTFTDPLEINVIDKNGDIRSAGIVTGLPGAQWAGGVIDRAGFYYVVSQNYNEAANPTVLYRIDLNNIERGQALTATQITLTGMPVTNLANGSAYYAMFDIAFNPKDGNLYGTDYAGRVYRIVVNGTAATVTLVGNSAINIAAIAGSGALGTCFFDISGALYAYANGTQGTAGSGTFYIIDVATGAATQLSTIDPAVNSDGASCVTPDQSLDVVKEVVSVTPSGTNRFDVAFSIKVRNNGSITDPNVQVSDLLWNGNATANAATTFSGANNVTISGLTVTNTAGATLVANTGATGFNGQSGQAGLLTGNQPLAAGQGATITFTAQVTFPSTAAVPTAAQNNTAYGTSTVASFIGYTLQGSALVPPPDLLAQDASTNSAALPTTPNEDVASPSPIYYATAILGNVFEDANYGGGAGRSQAVSNGEGVTGATVELYNATTNAYITSVTTDAFGNYVFTGTGVVAASTAYRVRVVNSTVVSNRPGSVAGLLPVQTFLNGDVNRVGGENPNEPDALARSGTQTLIQVEAALGTTIQSLTPAITTPASGPLLGVDFGFNFSTVVNTNSSGQGSLQQFILNSNTLTNANLDQAAFNGTVANGTLATDPVLNKEYAIFMLNDGRLMGAPAGLRNSMTAPAGYSAVTKQFTFTAPSGGFSSISDGNTAIDGSLQALLTGDNTASAPGTTTGPEILIDFNQQKGLFVTGASTRIASIGLNNARGSVQAGAVASTITFSDGAGVTINGAAATGSVVTDVTALNNAIAGVRLDGGVAGVTVSNSVMRSNVATTNSTSQVYDADGINLVNASGNTISGNTASSNVGWGILLAGSAGNANNTISSNTVSNNGTGTSGDDGGISIQFGSNNVLSQNTINNNAGDGIVAVSGTSNNLFTKNSFSGNAGEGIDLGTGPATGADVNGNGVSVNDNGDTDSGANGVLNFPVLTQAVITNSTSGNLQITGYAPIGSTIEFFLSDKTADGFGQGRTYLFSTLEGASMTAALNGTTTAIADGDTKFGNYSGTINGFNQGAETGAARFYFNIPLSSLTSTQVTALINSTARLTATATVAGNTTSEFSGNILIKQNSPLPVELKAFDVTTTNANANLTWSTASEKNNDRFDVERSFDGRSFERIGQVRGQGTTSRATTYSFTDVNIGRQQQGVVYYRLQQVDTDGTASFSPVRTVSFSAQVAAAVRLAVFPNPATAQDFTATLDLSELPKGTYQATLLDITGRSMATYEVQGGVNKILDVQALPAGTYLILVRGNGHSLSQRLIKK